VRYETPIPVTVTLKPVQVTGVGDTPIVGTGNVTLDSVEATGVDHYTTIGAGQVTLSSISMLGAPGLNGIDSTGAGQVTLESPSVSGTGETTLVRGIGHVTLAKIGAVGEGTSIYYGETPTIDIGYTVIRYLFSGPFTPPDGITEVEVLVVAGGGGTYGSGWYGSGAGAGGFLTGFEDVSGSMDVVVGYGGFGNNGQDSSFGSFHAIGGGRGGGYHTLYAPSSGGSGGGAGTDNNFGLGTIGQGNDGGEGNTGICGGGGGAGGVGGNGVDGGDGGAGLDSDIVERGVDVGYAGGGAGLPGGTVSHGGGVFNTSGTPDTGGGGGGGEFSIVTIGGSGIVIIRFPTPILGTGQVTLSALKVAGVGNNVYSMQGHVTLGAIVARGEGYVDIFSRSGHVTLKPVSSRGVGEAHQIFNGAGRTRTAKIRCAGVGTVTGYSGGVYTGTGRVTLHSSTLFGRGTQLAPGGVIPPPDPPPVVVPPWPPAPIVRTLTDSEHTLIGNISIAVGGVDYTPYAENLQWNVGVSGGYGACSFKLRPDAKRATPVPSYNDGVLITGPGGEYYYGTVVNTPEITYTGESISYEVVCEGPSRGYGSAEDFAWTSSDADVGAGGSWQQIDCQNWGDPPGFEISTSAGAGIGFLSADLKPGVIRHDYTEKPKTFYPEEWKPTQSAQPDGPDGPLGAISYYGKKPDGWFSNTPPQPKSPSAEGANPYTADCVDPEVRWSAHYYWIGNGLTNQRITGLQATAMYNLATPAIDAMIMKDFTNGTHNKYETWEDLNPMWDKTDPDNWVATVTPWQAVYEDINQWTFFGLESPGSMWAGIYAVDDPRELQVRKPTEMFNHSSRVWVALPRTFTVQAVIARDEEGHVIWNEMGNPTYSTPAGSESIDIGCDCRMLVFYATYVVTPMAKWQTTDFDPEFTEPPGYVYPGMGVTATKLVQTEPIKYGGWYASNEVYTEGKQYCKLTKVKVLANEAAGDSSADWYSAMAAASGGGVSGGFSIPADVSINIRPYVTRLAAIQQLVGMVSDPVYWGWDPGFFCTADRGTISFDPTIPGVTVSASVKNDGTIKSATVIYSEPMVEDGGSEEDNRVLAAWVPQSLTFDANGDGQVTPDESSGLIDGSYVFHSAEAAAAAAQSYVEERGVTGQGTGTPSEPQWEGTITLKGIPEAAATKVATKVDCGDVSGAVITGVSVDVDSDTVTLSLGGTGYKGRFHTSPGSPNSASPSNSSAINKMLPYMFRRR
jgi:hypothetical protein